MFGGGAGGGNPITGIDRLGATARGACVALRNWAIEGLWYRAGAADVRLPGRKDGVLETRRVDERKGAGSERIWTLVGRRKGCDAVGVDADEGFQDVLSG